MAWSMIGKPVAQVADHSLVSRFVSMRRFGGERKLDKTRCSRLRELLEEGKFRTCSWAVVDCLEDGQQYRINGQHTSHVLNEFNGSLPAVFVTVERYEADTLKDVADLFATFDPRWSTRTTSDTNRAQAAAIPELDGINSRAIDLAASGMAIHFGSGNRSRITQEQRSRNISLHSNFVLWLNNMEFVQSNQRRHMARSAVVGAMFATFQKSSEEATDFWMMVKNSSAPNADHPTRLLERYLMTAKGRTDDREIYAKCIHAWNYWRKGNKCMKIIKYHADAARPEAI